MSETKSWAIDNRDSRRLMLSDADGAYVEFADPGSTGGTMRLSVTSVSATGLAIVVTHGPCPFAVGTKVDGATVGFGRHRVRGRFEIVRVNPDGGSRTVCGARFDPASDDDRQALESGIRDIEAASSP